MVNNERRVLFWKAGSMATLLVSFHFICSRNFKKHWVKDGWSLVKGEIETLDFLNISMIGNIAVKGTLRRKVTQCCSSTSCLSQGNAPFARD